MCLRDHPHIKRLLFQCVATEPLVEVLKSDVVRCLTQRGDRRRSPPRATRGPGGRSFLTAALEHNAKVVAEIKRFGDEESSPSDGRDLHPLHRLDT